MSKIPKIVQNYIDVLKEYTENSDLEIFNIFHMYSDGLAYPNGYFDSKFFLLFGYNISCKQYKPLGRHDSLDFSENVKVEMVRIFADGSTLVKFMKPVQVIAGQNVNVFDLSEG